MGLKNHSLWSMDGWMLAYRGYNTIWMWRGHNAFIDSVTEEEKSITRPVEVICNDGSKRIIHERVHWREYNTYPK